MSAEDELREAQRQLYDAMVRHDTQALAPMLHDDLIFVHSTAVVEDKPTYLKGVDAKLYAYSSIVPRTTDVRVYDGFAVMNGIVDMNDTLHLQVTLVWTRSNGRWVVLVRGSTRLP